MFSTHLNGNRTLATATKCTPFMRAFDFPEVRCMVAVCINKTKIFLVSHCHVGLYLQVLFEFKLFRAALPKIRTFEWIDTVNIYFFEMIICLFFN